MLFKLTLEEIKSRKEKQNSLFITLRTANGRMEFRIRAVPIPSPLVDILDRRDEELSLIFDEQTPTCVPCTSVEEEAPGSSENAETSTFFSDFHNLYERNTQLWNYQ